MSGANAIVVASTFIWVGLIVGISFIEAPLKFRAPGVTIRIGLGIGRLVFRALNTVEAVLAVAVVAALVAGASTGRTSSIALGAAVGLLAAQLLIVRPRLNRRSDAVLASPDPVAATLSTETPSTEIGQTEAPTEPRSHTHLVYVALEVGKLVALSIGGIAALA